ncbi:MAG TPA: ATP-binding protein [Gemmatimonadaceae bacterium]|nr:ATP-binding protein [Gemmatimonadaceae bacterium]
MIAGLRAALAPARRQQTLRWILWLGILGVATAVLLWQRIRLDKAHVALIYLLIGLGASAHVGRRCGLTTAVLSFVLFNYLFVPPYYTLAVTHTADWIVLVAFLITSATAAHLLARAQAETEVARARATEIDRLSSLGAETLNLPRAEDALAAIAAVIRSTLRVAGIEIFTAGASGPILLVASVGDAESPAGTGYLTGDELVAWVAGSGRPVIERTDAAPQAVEPPSGTGAPLSIDVHDARSLLLPLAVQGRTVGVLRIADRGPIHFDVSQQRFLIALAHYAALGIERLRLVGEARHAEVLRETDRMKDALLASVSHDLRTPLTTIKALAHDIRLEGDDRAASIEDEADRLNRFVTDLLDLSRLSAGAIGVRCEVYPVDDLLGAALQRVGGRLNGHAINAAIAGGDPLLIGYFDFGHALRALVNLIENALKHSPPAEPVDVTAARTGDSVEIAVADRGPGISPADEERIFQPFHRPVDHADGGVGLGLSIARGLALAQGGQVEYAPRPDGGSIFTLRLRAVDLSDLAAPNFVQS